MSGPKGAAYAVVSEAELRRRAAQVTRARLRACRLQIDELVAVAEVDAVRAGKRPALRDTSEDPAELAAEEQAGLAYIEALQKVIADRRIAAATAQLQESLAGFRVTVALASRREIRPAASPADQRPALRERLGALAGRLSAVGEGDLARLTSAVRVVAAAIEQPDAARAGQLLGSLQAAVAEAVRLEREDSLHQARRRELRQEFADVPADDGAWAVWASATDALALTRARRLLVVARERQQRASDRDFVVAQATAALQALGYRVEGEEGQGLDALVARKDSWRHHGIRLLFPDSQAAFTTVPEAYGATDARDDAAFEEASCGDLQAVVQHLQANGVSIEMKVKHPPGTISMRHLGEPDRPTAVERERAR